MTVLVTLRVSADASKVEEMAAGEGAPFKTVTERAKELGCTRHRFYGSDSEVLVVDEWPNEASFHAFFEASPEIQDVMGKAGVTTAPEIKVWRKLDVGDDIG
jgi:quinol monooxygenase YgiN